MADAPKKALIGFRGFNIHRADQANTEYLRADLIDMDVLRRVEAALMHNHTWHLSQTEPTDMGGVEIVPAEAYSESAMCNATEAALADLRAIMGKLK